MGLIFGNGGFFDRLGNSISGNGWTSTTELAQQQAQEEQKRIAEEQEARFNSALQNEEFKNMSTEDQYLYMAENDASNNTAYMENYLALKAQREMRDTSLKSTMDQLKEAGINPLMAIQGINASTGSNSATGQVASTENARKLQKAKAEADMFTKSLFGKLMGPISLLIYTLIAPDEMPWDPNSNKN